MQVRMRLDLQIIVHPSIHPSLLEVLYNLHNDNNHVFFIFPVGLEQIVLDQSVYGGSFHKEFQETEYQLKYVSGNLCL